VSTPHHVGILPLPFAGAVHDLNVFHWDRRISVSELEPPTHIAPYAAAIAAEILDGDDEVASGRLILLYDPAGNDLWEGHFRCVTFAQSEVTDEMIHDPFLAQVGWSWLTDALQSCGARYGCESGTITTTSSTPFGTKEDEDQLSHIEIRASWTPDDDDSLTPHIEAWQDLLRQIAGIPSGDESVVALPLRSAVGP